LTMETVILIHTEHLQGELITSDIRFSGKAYLRGITLREPANPVSETEINLFLAKACQMAAGQSGRELLAGFRLDMAGFQVPAPENPPACFTFYTEFINLAAPVKMLSESSRRGGGDRENGFIGTMPVQDSQIDLLIQIRRESMHGVPNLPALTRDEVLERLPAGNFHLIFLEPGEKSGSKARQFVGFYDLAADLEKKTGELEEIGILPRHRSRGFGRLVISQIAGELDKSGIPSLELLVASSNESARRLYRELGFSERSLYSRWFRRSLV
jgi:ribosomal protein S18 acetylase RimI-like enzyme